MQKSLLSFNTIAPLTAAIAMAMAASAPAMADVTFAQYIQVNGATQQWAISTTGTTTTITASGTVDFLFSGVTTPFSGIQIANFSLTATSGTIGNCANTCANDESFSQGGYSGSFSIIDADSDPGANLLSGAFQVVGTGAQFSTEIGSSGGSFDASAAASDLNQLILTSAFLNFAGQTKEDASFSLSSLLPDFAVGTVTAGQAYPGTGPFDAAASATFSSNPGPTGTPEPASFAMIGGGLIGLGLLRRKKATQQ